MSEFDSLSDSDWLDISSTSAHDSDDTDSLSDHEEISSVPHSRRSSISNGSSMNSEVEAWEGFISDNGDEVVPHPHTEPVIGMYHAPLTFPLEPEPIPLGFIPDINDHSQVAPEVDEEDRRVRDALDQSFIGTLNASRSSTTGGHFSSTHTSVHDLRLSFPDPLTSSHDELNRSYDALSHTETTPNPIIDDDADKHTTPSIISASPPNDPGLAPIIPEVPRPGDLLDSEKSELEIVLYGASSDTKWEFIHEWVQKAAAYSGHVLVNPLKSGVGSEQIQTIRFYRDSEDAFQFFNAVTVHDRTGDKQPPKFEVVCIKHDLPHCSSFLYPLSLSLSGLPDWRS